MQIPESTASGFNWLFSSMGTCHQFRLNPQASGICGLTTWRQMRALMKIAFGVFWDGYNKFSTEEMKRFVSSNTNKWIEEGQIRVGLYIHCWNTVWRSGQIWCSTYLKKPSPLDCQWVELNHPYSSLLIQVHCWDYSLRQNSNTGMALRKTCFGL